MQSSDCNAVRLFYVSRSRGSMSAEWLYLDWLLTRVGGRKIKMSEPIRIAKIDADKQQVFGWANVSVRKSGQVISDHQGHEIPTDELAEAAYEFCLSSRLSGAEHTDGYITGRMIESVVFTKEKMAAMGIPVGTVPEGWWLGVQIDDATAWEKVKKGEYSMFSIEGVGVAEDVT